jgi:hypothetical protein
MKLFVFFDIETLISNEKILYPLSCVYFILEENELTKYDWNTNKIEYIKRCVFSYNVNYIYTRINNPLSPIIKHILYLSRNNDIQLIGYNSSAFDLFFILDEIKNNTPTNPNIFIVKNRIYNMKFNKINSLDLYLHLKMSLIDACKAFKTQPHKLKNKGENILNTLQIAYNDGSLIQLSNHLKNKLEKYNKYDVLCLVSLLKNYNELIQSIKSFNNYKVYNYLTLPSMLSAKFKNDIYDKYNILKPYSKKDYLTFKKWQCGGIVGIFGPNGWSKKVSNVYLVDITSQYPYVCLENDFPCGDYKFEFLNGLEIPKNKLGIYWCIINISSLHIPLIAKVNKNKTNNWQTQKEDYEQALTTPEIIYLEKKGCKVIPLYGYIWMEKCNPFREVMEEISKLKVIQDKIKIKIDKGLPLLEGEEYDVVKRGLYKLILNAITGAVNQKIYKNDSRPFLGNYIYAYSRLLLCKVGNELGPKEVLYGDTDSLIITKQGLLNWKNNEEIKTLLVDENNEKFGEFGLFKCEGFYKEAILIDKKIYCLLNKNACYNCCNCPIEFINKSECINKNHYRLKGIGVGIKYAKNIFDSGYAILIINKQSPPTLTSEQIKKQIDKEVKQEIEKYLYNFFLNSWSEYFRIYNFYYSIYKTQIEEKYFNINNEINNMRDLRIYEDLFNSYILKLKHINMLSRNIKKDYKIKCITKEQIITPNPQQYHKIISKKLLSDKLKNVSTKLNNCILF